MYIFVHIVHICGCSNPEVCLSLDFILFISGSTFMANKQKRNETCYFYIFDKIYSVIFI